MVIWGGKVVKNGQGDNKVVSGEIGPGGVAGNIGDHKTVFGM